MLENRLLAADIQMPNNQKAPCKHGAMAICTYGLYCFNKLEHANHQHCRNEIRCEELLSSWVEANVPSSAPSGNMLNYLTSVGPETLSPTLATTNALRRSSFSHILGVGSRLYRAFDQRSNFERKHLRDKRQSFTRQIPRVHDSTSIMLLATTHVLFKCPSHWEEGLTSAKPCRG